MSNSPLPILHIVPKLSVSGGVGNQLLALLRQYNRNELVPVVCSLRESGEVGREIEALGIEMLSFDTEFKKGFYPGIVKKLYTIIKSRNIRIVRTHEYRSNIHGVPAAWLAGADCIVSSHHNVYLPRDRKLNRRLTNKFLSWMTDGIVAVSNAVKNDVIRYDGIPESKVTVIYNGMDPDRFMKGRGDVVRQEFGIPSTMPVIGTVGRLFPQKGQKVLIEAAEKLKGMPGGFKMLIAGEGPLLPELTQHAKTLGLADEMVFAGNRRDIPDLIAAMDVFVFPSLWEGFGNVLIEAMAAGRPVVASDIPAVREIISRSDEGMIVPAGNAQGMADAIKKLLSDRPLAESMGSSARQRAIEMFSIRNTCGQYISLYKKIFRQKNISFPVVT